MRRLEIKLSVRHLRVALHVLLAVPARLAAVLRVLAPGGAARRLLRADRVAHLRVDRSRELRLDELLPVAAC